MTVRECAAIVNVYEIMSIGTIIKTLLIYQSYTMLLNVTSSRCLKIVATNRVRSFRI